MKEGSEGRIIGEFVGVKPKMYSMKNIDNKESNTAKGVNIATEFNEFKDNLLNKKNNQTKFKVKNIKYETRNTKHTKSTKYHYQVLMKKDLF